MTDRNVQFPNRYQLVKVPGTDDIYDLTPAPGTITAEGTMINKATLLSDETAGLLGLPNTAVPDDAFKTLNSAFNSMALKTTLLNSWTSDGSILVIPVDGGALTSGRYLLKIESSDSGSLNLEADKRSSLSAVQLQTGSTTLIAHQNSAFAAIDPENPAVIELVYSTSDLSAFYITPGVLRLLSASNATQIRLTGFTSGTKFYLYKEE